MSKPATDKPPDPLEVQFHLAHDCIRACVYADYIATTRPLGDAWLSISDTLYSDAIITWNKLFGTNSQESHWKRVSPSLVVPADSTLRPFDSSLILEFIGTSKAEWEAFHAAVVDFRNKRLVHFDATVNRENFPNITWLLQSARLYRCWLLAALTEQVRAGATVSITDTTDEQMMQTFRMQIAAICPLTKA